MPPRATYRLQFHKEFPFAAAAEIAPYLRDLGISHVYASPILTARPGSQHGYDVLDHSRINPELGGMAGFRAMAETLQRHGLGIILDIVPNHMAVGPDNALWWDILTNGRASRYARWFDIDFDGIAPELAGKVLLPCLGQPYGEVLASGDLHLAFNTARDAHEIVYREQRFPLRQSDRADISAAGPDSYNDTARLHALLEMQHYRLAWWRTAGDQINYRRFFEINDLAALRMEEPDAFEEAHRLTFALYAEGLIDGVRIDHIDGLADPESYCRALRERLDALATRRPDARGQEPAYVIVEKILGAGEALPAAWQTQGTTGYDFMDQVSALQHAASGEALLTSLWAKISGRSPAFDDEEKAARREIVANSFYGHRAGLVAGLRELAASQPAQRDITAGALDRAITSVLAHLRVYRSYATGGENSPPAGADFAAALAGAAAEPMADTAALSFIAALMDNRLGCEETISMRHVRSIGHLSAPVAAKAVEDTAFYRYGRLLSRNDVGFEAARLAQSLPAFHALMRWRAEEWPQAMLATASHDHKRGEDVRARLAVISEMPQRWAGAVARWFTLNAAIRPEGLDPSDEYMLYQTIAGAWPPGLQPGDTEGLQALAQRLEQWWRKALREAKLRSNWATPDEAYETAAAAFVRTAFDPARSAAFIASMGGFVAAVAAAGAMNGLVQLTLRCTLPGLPDFYQGCEFWDFSLVDPDNRRPVDFTARRAALKPGIALETLLPAWHDGRLKQALAARLLALRGQAPELFLEGRYDRLHVSGTRAEHVVAFARVSAGWRLTVVAARCCAEALADGERLAPPSPWWGDTMVALPGPGDRSGALPVASLLPSLPIGVWLQPQAAGEEAAAAAEAKA